MKIPIQIHLLQFHKNGPDFAARFLYPLTHWFAEVRQMCARPRCSVLALTELQWHCISVLNFRADHPEQDLGHATDIPVVLAISYVTVMECSTVTDPSTFSTTSNIIQ
jgi:hypothetical protein